MGEIVDFAGWREVLVSSLTQLGIKVVGYLPNLIGAALILGVGWIVSRILRTLSIRAFRRFGIDRAGDRLRISAALQSAGVTMPLSEIMGRIFFWVPMFAFVLSAAEVLGLTAVEATVNRLILYLPNLLAAVLILVVGLLFGNLVRHLVRSGAKIARISQGRAAGAVAHAIVALVTVVLTLEQLGIDTRILVTVSTALVATFGLTMGLAFALGSRKIIAHILAGHHLRQSLPMDRVISIRDRKGTVERVGAIETVFRDGEKTWSMPNSALAEEIIDR